MNQGFWALLFGFVCECREFAVVSWPQFSHNRPDFGGALRGVPPKTRDSQRGEVCECICGREDYLVLKTGIASFPKIFFSDFSADPYTQPGGRCIYGTCWKFADEGFLKFALNLLRIVSNMSSIESGV